MSGVCHKFNMFKLGKYVVAWSLPLAQTSNTKTRLHKRSRQTIQGTLKKQPANVLLSKTFTTVAMRFQTTVDKQRIEDLGRCVQYLRSVCGCVCGVWIHIHYIAQEISAFTYAMCSVIIILEVVTPPPKSEWMRNTWTPERSQFWEDNVMTCIAHKANSELSVISF